MAKINDERLEIRDSTYRVPFIEVCRTCRHWRRHPWNDFGACRAVSVQDTVMLKNTDQFGTCDLWEGKPSDK